MPIPGSRAEKTAVEKVSIITETVMNSSEFKEGLEQAALDLTKTLERLTSERLLTRFDRDVHPRKAAGIANAFSSLAQGEDAEKARTAARNFIAECLGQIIILQTKRHKFAQQLAGELHMAEELFYFRDVSDERIQPALKKENLFNHGYDMFQEKLKRDLTRLGSFFGDRDLKEAVENAVLSHGTDVSPSNRDYTLSAVNQYGSLIGNEL